MLSYYPSLTKREDFDSFWELTKDQAYKAELSPVLMPYDYPSPYVKVYKISYKGFDDTKIKGWYILPSFLDQKEYPCLIHYHGYRGNSGSPADFMHWIMMGLAVISIDCRGQSGNTGNHAKYSSGSTQSVVCQGGALAMAVCALDSRPCIMMADVPSNSHIEKRVEGAHGSFSFVTDYLKIYPHDVDKVFETLSYFDTMNMADRIMCKVLASVGLKDDICPAKMYFASYNRIKANKEIKMYPFNGHDGGGRGHMVYKMKFLKQNL